MVKNLKILLLQNQDNFETDLGILHLGLNVNQVYSDGDPRMNFDLFITMSNLRFYTKC